MNILTIDELNQNLRREAKIIKHLAGKIPEGTLGYKPTEKQRTTLEVLQYISHLPSSLAATVQTGAPSAFGAGEEKAESVTLETFAEALDASVETAAQIFSSFTEEQINEPIDPFKMGPVPRRNMMVNLLSMLVAYKMQLFLYAKAAGNDKIGTSNLWAGIDWPQN